MDDLAEVRLWGRTIGAVAQRRGIGYATFQYDPAFTQSAIEIAPHRANGPVATYCHNTVMPVPRAATNDADRALALAFGRDITRRVLAGEIPKDTIGAAPRAALDAIDFPPAAD